MTPNEQPAPITSVDELRQAIEELPRIDPPEAGGEWNLHFYRKGHHDARKGAAALLSRFAPPTDRARVAELEAENRRLREALVAAKGEFHSIATNYDHRVDGHRYGTDCYVCTSEAAEAAIAAALSAASPATGEGDVSRVSMTGQMPARGEWVALFVASTGAMEIGKLSGGGELGPMWAMHPECGGGLIRKDAFSHWMRLPPRVTAPEDRT